MKALGLALRETGQALDRLGLRMQRSLLFEHQLSRRSPTVPISGHVPKVTASSFVAPSATLLGSVSMAPHSSVWYGAVVRGDPTGLVTIGEGSNIQDHCVITSYVGHTSIGKDVTIGHSVCITDAQVGDQCLIGMGAIIGQDVIIESCSIVAAGAVVMNGSVVKAGELWAGIPATKVRDVSPAEKMAAISSAANYSALAAEHARSIS